MSGAGHDLNRIRLWHWLTPVAAFALVAAKFARHSSRSMTAGSPRSPLCCWPAACLRPCTTRSARRAGRFSLIRCNPAGARDHGNGGRDDHFGDGFGIKRQWFHRPRCGLRRGDDRSETALSACAWFPERCATSNSSSNCRVRLGILSVITTLAVITLILPNYSLTTQGRALRRASWHSSASSRWCCTAFSCSSRHSATVRISSSDEVQETIRSGQGGRAKLH